MNNFTTEKKKVNIVEVFPNAWNPNLQTDVMFKAEMDSISKHGFIDPILVREKDGIYEIIDGEHRWKACMELQYTEIIVESLGQIDDITAKTLTIEMNNLRGKDDILKRAQLLKEIMSGQGSLFSMSQKDIEEEMKLLDFDFSQFKNVDVKEVDICGEVLQKIISLENSCRLMYQDVKDNKMKLLFETYFEFAKVMKEMCKNYKK